MWRDSKRLWEPLLITGSDIYLPSQIAGNFHAKPAVRPRQPDAVYLKGRHERPRTDGQNASFGEADACTWADFCPHLFIFLWSLPTSPLSAEA